MKTQGNTVPESTTHRFRRESAHWETLKAEFVSAAWLAYMRDQAFIPLYAYVKPSSPGVWGELAFVRESSEPRTGFQLVTAERIPATDKAGIARWFERFAGRLPVFPQDVQP